MKRISMASCRTCSSSTTIVVTIVWRKVFLWMLLLSISSQVAYGFFIFKSNHARFILSSRRKGNSRQRGYVTPIRTSEPLISTQKICKNHMWEIHKNHHKLSLSVLASSSTNDGVNEASTARSEFGTFQYWDDMYNGMGDFPADEYSWYYGWETLKPYFVDDVVSSLFPENDQLQILLPGIGNDPLLLDLYGAGYKYLTAFDYSSSAIERQEDLLWYAEPDASTKYVKMFQGDARNLQKELPSDSFFDIVLEKGAFDAIYLSGDGNLEQSIEEMKRLLKPGGILMSVSGVVPEELRRTLLPKSDWEWIRDGSDDLKAGCFILKHLKKEP